MSSGFNITDASVSNLTKRKYGPKALNMYNGLVAALSITKKTWDNVGERVERPVPTGYCGGASLGRLGTANRGVYERAYFTTKKVYVVGEVDRRTIKQFKNEGAFVDGIQETMRKIVEKFNWVMNFLLMGNSDGVLGIISSVSDQGGGTYDLTITAASWVKARWEVREHVNISDGDDSLFEITAVTRSTKVVRVVRRSGSHVPVAAESVYIDGGYGNAPEGYLGVCGATAGATKYGITVADRWISYQKAASSAGISPDILNEVNAGMYDNVGFEPTHIFMPTTQVQKLVNSMEDQKRYSLTPTKLSPKAENLIGKVSFAGVEFQGLSKPIPIVTERFLPEDTIVFANNDENEIAHSDQGWFDDDGTVWLRKANGDAYECRYGGYLEMYLPPTLQGIVTGLSTAL